MVSPIEFVAVRNNLTIDDAKTSIYPSIFDNSWLSRSQKTFKSVLESEEVSGSNALKTLRMFKTIDEVKHLSTLIPAGVHEIGCQTASVPLDNSRVSFVLDTPDVNFKFSNDSLFYFAVRLAVPLSDKSMTNLLAAAVPETVTHTILTVFSLKRDSGSFHVPLTEEALLHFRRSPVFEKMVSHYFLAARGENISKPKRKLIVSYLEHTQPSSMQEICSLLD